MDETTAQSIIHQVRSLEDSINASKVPAHPPGAILLMTAEWVQTVNGIWDLYRRNIGGGTYSNLEKKPEDVAVKYAVNQCFNIDRVASEFLSKRIANSRGKLTTKSFKNDFQTTTLASLATVLAIREFYSVLSDNIKQLERPDLGARKQIKEEVCVILARRFRGLIEDYVDEIRRSLYDLGFSFAAAMKTVSSNWTADLSSDIEFIYYGRLPDNDSNDNSRYSPNPQHALLLIRTYLEEATFLEESELETIVPDAVRSELEKISPRQSNPHPRLKLYRKLDRFGDEFYQAIDNVYKRACETVHASRTCTMTDIWVMKSCVSQLIDHLLLAGWDINKICAYSPPKPSFIEAIKERFRRFRTCWGRIRAFKD